MKERFDVNYWLSLSLYEQLYARPVFPLTPLRQLVTLVQYGISERATVEPVGTPILRMNNLQAEGWDLTDLKYVELDEQTKKSFLLKPGDLLFNRTNSKELVGKCDVFQEPGEWVFASYLIRVQLDEKKALPVFVSDFLNIRAGRVQIDRVSRQIIGMSNVNAEELQNLLIPLPPTIEIQQAFIAEMNAAREARRRKVVQAADLLGSLHGWLLKQLGLPLPDEEKRNVFAVKLRTVCGDRLDVAYNSPNRYEAKSSRYEALPLNALVESFSGGTPTKSSASYWDGDIPWVSPKDFGSFYIGDSEDHISEAGRESARLKWVPQNSVLVVVRSGILKHSMPVAVNTRPLTINQDIKVLIPAERIRAEFLAGYFYILGKRLLTSITKHSTTVQSINTDQFDSLMIPVPPLTKQDEIVSVINDKLEQARRLRAEAEAEWQVAKHQFEQQLLSGSTQ